jgi:nucleotide-binding universal stress UspA family protein
VKPPTAAVTDPAGRDGERRGPGRQILVPLNGSWAAEAIVPIVERLWHEPGVTIRLLHAVTGGATGDGVPSPHLARIVAALREHGLTCGMASVTPGPSTRSWAPPPLGGADLLALTGHSENTAHRVPLGHVAAYLLRQAPVPVLL